MKNLFTILIPCLTLLLGCSTDRSESLKVVASSVPHAEILEVIQPELFAQGITLQIIISDDYNMPNRALANHEVDANFFQHLPFMEEQIKQFNYAIESLVKVEIEPMGIYSNKIKTLEALSNGATIAIPNDPTNEGRALLLLQQQGIIHLDRPDNLQATILNIRDNPKKLKFIEVDAAMLPRTLGDVAAAAINTNYAMQANLSPQNDALILEDDNSPYVNIIAIRSEDRERSDIQALKKAITSEKVREFILQKYKGAILPAF